ncbi:MAG: DUF2845 domain-containing protein [Steroidobacter sp.]
MRAPILSLLLLSVWLAGPAQADAMRCGSQLISDGDTRTEVRELCGDPSDVQRRTILRRPYYDFHGRLVYYGDGLIEIPVEIWTYNLGPYKLMRRLRFVDGRVEEIETLGYGYHASKKGAAELEYEREGR